MSRSKPRHEQIGDEPERWPHEPPPELLEALDRAAARLSELDARGVRISLGIGSDGNPTAHLSGEGFDRELGSLPLLQLVCGSKLQTLHKTVA